MDDTNVVPRAIFRNTDEVNAYLLDLDNYIFNVNKVRRTTGTIKDILEDIEVESLDCLRDVLKSFVSYGYITPNFNNTLFEGDFSDIDLVNYILDGAKIINSNFSNAKLNGVHLLMYI